MSESKEKIFTLDCNCNDIGLHNVKVWIDKEDNDVAIYTSMNHYLPWYKRLVNAVRYTFGCDNTFIDYQETMVSLDKFTEVVQDITNYCKEK
mgnify:CR=1 FL=1